MEVFKNETSYDVALSYYNDNVLSGLSYITIFNFDMSASTPQISHYHVSIPGESNQSRIVKGLGYSSSGLVLSASVMTINSTYTSIISGNNVIYFDRGNIGSPFSYGGVITAGSTTSDFGLGMIEKGKNGKLWVVGDGRLGSLADNDNPLSLFTTTAINISNQLTNSSAYSNGISPNLPSTNDILNRKMYLLIDQIDGENYGGWTTGSDLYPSFLETCLFPYTFPYVIPPNASITYTGQSILTNGTLVLQTEGTLTISYVNEYGCLYTETVDIWLVLERWCSADGFSRLISETVNPDVLVTAACDSPGATNHEFYLYESDGQGGWILLDSCYSASCTLTGLYNNQSFKIVHKVYNLFSTCHFHESASQYFTIN